MAVDSLTNRLLIAIDQVFRAMDDLSGAGHIGTTVYTAGADERGEIRLVWDESSLGGKPVRRFFRVTIQEVE